MIIILSVLLILNTALYAIVLRNRNKQIEVLQNALRNAIDDIDTVNRQKQELRNIIQICKSDSELYAKKLQQVYDICQDKTLMAKELRRQIGLISNPAYLDFDDSKKVIAYMTPGGVKTRDITNTKEG